jgi:hypothetical protein
MLRDHEFEGVMAAQAGAVEIYGTNLLEPLLKFGFAHFVQRRAPQLIHQRIARTAHEHVKTVAAPILQLHKHFANGGHGSHIRNSGESPDAVLLTQCGGKLLGFSRVATVDGYRSAAACEQLCRSAPNAAAGAGDEHGTVTQAGQRDFFIRRDQNFTRLIC